MSAKAAILGCSGLALTSQERDFFQIQQPLGFILFARNIEDPDQVKTLVKDLRSCVNHDLVPVLIDQEGGRVVRLPKSHWRIPPAGEVFGELYKLSPQQALRAIHLNSRLIAHDLAELGVDVNCAPILDVRIPGADKIVGDRAYSDDPKVVAELGRGVIAGLHRGGVLSVIKHLPTHGPADVDSHLKLPVVEWPSDQLQPHFDVFKAHNTAPWGMTAHIVYKTLDLDQPATYSAKVINGIIRERIGFQGFLISDDLGMKALQGPWDIRAERALAAGCDAVLHCSGEMEEMVDVMKGVTPLSTQSAHRFFKGYDQLVPQPIDVAATQDELASLLTLRKAS